ncbi:hypothetical protein V8F33_005206 [Rhypophila sp. PSN 637]
MMGSRSPKSEAPGQLSGHKPFRPEPGQEPRLQHVAARSRYTTRTSGLTRHRCHFRKRLDGKPTGVSRLQRANMDLDLFGRISGKRLFGSSVVQFQQSLCWRGSDHSCKVTRFGPRRRYCKRATPPHFQPTNHPCSGIIGRETQSCLTNLAWLRIYLAVTHYELTVSSAWPGGHYRERGKEVSKGSRGNNLCHATPARLLRISYCHLLILWFFCLLSIGVWGLLDGYVRTWGAQSDGRRSPKNWKSAEKRKSWLWSLFTIFSLLSS